MRRIERCAVALALLATGVCGRNEAIADVRLPQVFGNHMVLQQGMANPIWGFAEAGEQVTVTIGDAKEVATTGKDGRWLVKVAAPPVGGAAALWPAAANSPTKIAAMTRRTSRIPGRLSLRDSAIAPRLPRQPAMPIAHQASAVLIWFLPVKISRAEPESPNPAAVKPICTASARNRPQASAVV